MATPETLNEIKAHQSIVGCAGNLERSYAECAVRPRIDGTPVSTCHCTPCHLRPRIRSDLGAEH
ncbi:hypothetical protein B0H12DRAFT_1119981 [Mycena haematopus]|nr:hypothetical protein B0H12DRAFT_1119981 [Mycena haematopus]